MRISIKLIVLLLTLVLPVNIFAGKELPEAGETPPKLDFRQMNTKDAFDEKSLKDRVVVIEFWATWCPPCIKNIPHMNQLVKTFSGKPVTFLAITYEPERMLEPFLKEHKIDSIIGIDNDFHMFKSYKAWGIPMAVVVNREGRIAAVTHPSNLSDALLNEVLSGGTPKVEAATPWPDPEGAEKYFRSLIQQ